MARGNNLWSNSGWWRAAVCSTLLLTAALLLLDPWAVPASTGAAHYTPQAPVAGSGAAAVGNAPSPVTPVHAPRDPAFDIPVEMGNSTFSSDTELHAIGVYEAAIPDSEKQPDPFLKCLPLSGDSMALLACHNKNKPKRTLKTIPVYVNRTNVPVVLALMAYEPVRWKIITRPGVDLRKVIISGYYGQDVEGLPDSIPVDSYSYEASPCQNCSRKSGHFYAYKQEGREYDEAMRQLQSITGLAVTSFQGGYKAERFNLTGTARDSARAASNADSYAGKVFSNHIEVSGKTLLLPDGKWLALAQTSTPSNRGTDQFLLLSQADGNVLKQLLVIRLQRVNDHQGFMRYPACDLPADYASTVRANEDLGAQLCSWSNFTYEPWKQPVFRLAASKLGDLGIAVSAAALSDGFHKADADTAITTLYYTFAKGPHLASAPPNWSDSPWHPQHASQFADVQAQLKQRQDWAADWFQIFGATQ